MLAQTRVHWSVIAWPLLAAGLVSLPAVGTWSGRAVLLLGISRWILMIWAASSLINFLTSHLDLTETKLLGKVGFPRGKMVEMDLSNVESISVKQGALGRLLGYGSLIVDGPGDVRLSLGPMIDPLRFATQVKARLEAVRRPRHRALASTREPGNA